MKTRFWRTALLSACVLHVCNCADRLAGGTVETTNGITAMVRLPNGKPAAATQVYLVDESDWLARTKRGESVLLDSTATDNNGNFKIKKDTSVHASLLVNVEGYGVLIRNVNQPDIIKLFDRNILLRPHVTYTGFLDDPYSIANRVHLAGTPYSATVNPETGMFALENIPQQRYSVVVQRIKADQRQEFIAAKEIDLDEWTSGKTDTLLLDTSKVLVLEDFQDDDNRNKIGNLLGGIGGGFWDFQTDHSVGGNSTLNIPLNAAAGSVQTAIENLGGALGLSLRVNYQQGATVGLLKPYPFVYADLRLGAQNMSYNLAKADTLSFWAKGDGDLIVEFVQFPPHNLHVVATAARITLDSAWRRYFINPEALTVTVHEFPTNPGAKEADWIKLGLPAYKIAPATWAEMERKAQSIRFLGTGGNEFWLDDISLHGIDLGDL